MRLLEILLIAFALFGHLALWVYVYNRLHALPVPCWLISLLEKCVYALVLAGFGLGGWLTLSGQSLLPAQTSADWMSLTYFGPCCVIGLVTARKKLWRDSGAELDRVFLSQRQHRVDVVPPAGQSLALGFRTRLLAAVPGNEIFQLEVNEKVFRLPRLPEALDGLTIAHLSDLHYTGRVARSFYDRVIDEVLALDADLVMVAGDIIDKPCCLDWIPQTLGRLNPRHGGYVVLGNHDKRIRDIARLRSVIDDSGMIQLGGRTLDVDIRGERILLAGSELPWFRPAPEIPSGECSERPFRLLLSHSPDQIGWARARQFDLMLAGHTHGGQIRFPWIGPVIAPSRYGVRYASGVFYEPPTLMHVSRGVAGLHPIRLNCRPEISKLVLRRG